MEKTLGKNSRDAWGPEAFQAAEPSREQLGRAAAELRERLDWTEGGFAGLTEEQENGALLFLLEYARRSGDDWCGAMAEAVLERRGRTGSPLRAYACLEAYAQSGRPGRRTDACAVLDGALREKRLPGGGFAETGEVSLVWNAQMIAALAKAYRVLGESAYLRAAEEARLFLKAQLTQSGGRLWQHWREGTPSGEGQLEDYGFYCWALAELYGADLSVSCLREASALADRMTEIFRDPQGGLYDFESGDAGRSIAGLALSRVGRLTGLERHWDAAREQLAWLAGTEIPENLALLGLTEELWPCRTLVCTCAGAPPAFLALVGEEYRMMALAKTRDNNRSLENAAPWLRMFPVPESGTRLYLCRDGLCEAAADDLFQLYQRLPSERTAEAAPAGMDVPADGTLLPQ